MSNNSSPYSYYYQLMYDCKLKFSDLYESSHWFTTNNIKRKAILRFWERLNRIYIPIVLFENGFNFNESITSGYSYNNCWYLQSNVNQNQTNQLYFVFSCYHYPYYYMYVAKATRIGNTQDFEVESLNHKLLLNRSFITKQIDRMRIEGDTYRFYLSNFFQTAIIFEKNKSSLETRNLQHTTILLKDDADELSYIVNRVALIAVVGDGRSSMTQTSTTNPVPEDYYVQCTYDGSGVSGRFVFSDPEIITEQ